MKISIAENGSFSTLNYIVYEKDYSSNYKRGNFHLGTIFIYFTLDKNVLKFRECEYFQHDEIIHVQKTTPFVIFNHNYVNIFI